MLELATKLYPTLTVIQNLFDAFHENNILYCHWKSNEHLAASMVADTDLDVLFSEKQKEKLKTILNKIGFKQFDAIRQKQYKDIVDFIGLDLQSGKIIHLHTHYRLTVGEPYLKGYQLNWEEKVLSSRAFDESFGIYCIDPVFEFILLYVRESLKLRHRDALPINLKNKAHNTENALREFHWLNARVTNSKILNILKTIFKHPLPIYKLMTDGFGYRQLRKLAPLLKIELADQRLHSTFKALQIRWYREVSVIIAKRLAPLLNRPILSKRVNPRGGVIVALMSDNKSIKFTIVAELRKTFEEKLDVYIIGFGRVRNNDLKRMQIAKEKGMLVICDHDLTPPTVAFKLVAGDELTGECKPEEHFPKTETKIVETKQLHLRGAFKVITVDTTKPLQEVLLIIKKEIWNVM